MNVQEYTWLINKPDAVNDKHTELLERIIHEFPYFQSARALYLKGLYNQNSFKYNYALKVTAAHTVDRSILFDFITSDTFKSIQKDLYEKKTAEILDITVKESEIVEPRLEVRENTIENSILTSIKESGAILHEETDVLPSEPEKIPEIEIESEEIHFEPVVKDENQLENAELGTEKTEEVAEELQASEEAIQTAKEHLEIDKPLAFSTAEKHSFQEWLQLSRIKPINRDNPDTEDGNADDNLDKQKKNELIDRFIETSPKIPQVKHDTPLPPPIIFEPSQADNSYLMTETLARVYLEQKKYHKAIQAYEILILKYPEKSSFFADRISDIKNLQKNNN